jgi:hypothetical protein
VSGYAATSLTFLVPRRSDCTSYGRRFSVKLPAAVCAAITDDAGNVVPTGTAGCVLVGGPPEAGGLPPDTVEWKYSYGPIQFRIRAEYLFSKKTTTPVRFLVEYGTRPPLYEVRGVVCGASCTETVPIVKDLTNPRIRRVTGSRAVLVKMFEGATTTSASFPFAFDLTVEQVP